MSATRRAILSPARARRQGLTLVEVLATIVMVAIVLPAAMQGISACLSASRDARQRSEASALAEAKLNEILATGDWQFGSLSGEFGEGWPDYRWGAGSAAWASDATMAEVYVRVTWANRGLQREVVLTTLVYQGESATGASGL